MEKRLASAVLDSINRTTPGGFRMSKATSAADAVAWAIVIGTAVGLMAMGFVHLLGK